MHDVRVFLAGAGGAIGTRLVPLLLDAGYDVFGTTRSKERAGALEAAGVKPIVINVFDAPALSRAMVAVRPQIVIHQLTDLPRGLEPSRLPEALARNARIRSEGTRNRGRLRSQELSCATDSFTVRAQGRTSRPTLLPYMSMLQPPRRFSRLDTLAPAPSTLPKRTNTSPRTRHAANSAGPLISD